MNYFFFQAEDGIRDFHVTGVQTCALPIWRRPPARWPRWGRRRPRRSAARPRSEERRVGERAYISVVAASLKKKRRNQRRRYTASLWIYINISIYSPKLP